MLAFDARSCVLLSLCYDCAVAVRGSVETLMPRQKCRHAALRPNVEEMWRDARGPALLVLRHIRVVQGLLNGQRLAGQSFAPSSALFCGMLEPPDG